MLQQKLALILIALAVFAIGGCTPTKYLSNRTIRENALTDPLKLVGPKGPQISDRTWNTLHRFGLEDQFKKNSQVCFAQWIAVSWTRNRSIV